MLSFKQSRLAFTKIVQNILNFSILVKEMYLERKMGRERMKNNYDMRRV